MSTEQGGEEWGRILASLDGKIMSNAPSCERLSLPSGWGWRLGDTTLRLEPVRVDQYEVWYFEVTAYSSIKVTCPSSKGYGQWSHSLWYGNCKPDTPDDFQWYEIAFSEIPIFSESRQPYYALSPEEADDLPMGAYNYFELVDPFEFAERWARSFASGVLGELKAPV